MTFSDVLTMAISCPIFWVPFQLSRNLLIFELNWILNVSLYHFVRWDSATPDLIELFRNFQIKKQTIKAAFHPCVNVYIYKPINRSEWRSCVTWVIKSKAKLINNKKKVSTDRASMILRRHEQSVLQSLCSIYKHFLDLFISLYAIHIHWKCAKLKKIKA